jgi:hypothetical protein
VIALRAADNNARRVAVGGVLLALLIALLYLKTVLPVLDLSIYVLISFLPGIVLIETDAGYAWIFFAASSLLSLVLPVNKLNFLLYYSFFGYYGIIKYHLEKINPVMLVFTAKAAIAAAAFSLNFFLASAFLPSYIANKGNFLLLLVIAVVFLFIYDYIYTVAMVFYHDRIKQKRG